MSFQTISSIDYDKNERYRDTTDGLIFFSFPGVDIH